MTWVILFVFGAIVGSFLNVVALRWDLPNHGRVFSQFGGRSYCPSCKVTLRWWELVPIFSFFFLRAKCKRCRNPISWQYPLIELFTGLIFATVPLGMLPVFCFYIAIAAYDARTKIIPDELVYTSTGLSILYAFLFGNYGLLDWFSGPIIFLFFASIWFITRGRAMGFGDAKLGLSIGFLLGAALGFSAIILAFWIGAVVSLTILGMGRLGFLKSSDGLTIKSEVPFAPFMILGVWGAVLFELNILNVLSL